MDAEIRALNARLLAMETMLFTLIYGFRREYPEPKRVVENALGIAEIRLEGLADRQIDCAEDALAIVQRVRSDLDQAFS